MARLIDFRPLRPNPELAVLGCALALWLVAAMGHGAMGADSPTMRALLVGGGPNKENNTAQIEEHLRFVAGLVPPSAGRIILFADGKPESHSLTYTDESHLSGGQRALDVLLPNDAAGAKTMTRTPAIGSPIDGPSKLTAIAHAFDRLAGQAGKSTAPMLVYFAGHGSEETDKPRYSLYNLWGTDDLDPPALLRAIDTLPAKVPVVLVMAQCFSGGFGNVLFKNANPDSALNGHLIAGFFSAESNREAAGCGTETNSPYYQDFSSYFFGALSGKDRLGQTVTGADYDGDGTVTCHEAYCYALIHDDSIDTPVCTSLLFLRRFAPMDDADIFSTPWQTILDGATPAQKAALEAISGRLGIDGGKRLLDAYDRLMFSDPMGQPQQLKEYRDAQDQLNTFRMESLHSLFEHWPALRWKDSRDYDKALRGAAADLDKDHAWCKELLASDDSFNKADAALDAEEAMLVRFTDLAETIVRKRWLRDHADAAIKNRFEAIWRLEQRPLAIAPPSRQ